MILGELEYWRFKAKILELQAEQMQLELLVRGVDFRRVSIARERGFSGEKNLRFDDVTFSVEEITNG